MMNNLESREHTILLLPTWVSKMGLKEAVFVRHLHSWVKNSKHIHDGSQWVTFTYEQWKKQFPFWSISTIQRITVKLEKMKIIKVGNYNQHKLDKSKWYSINYDILNDIVEGTWD